MKQSSQQALSGVQVLEKQIVSRIAFLMFRAQPVSMVSDLGGG